MGFGGHITQPGRLGRHPHFNHRWSPHPLFPTAYYTPYPTITAQVGDTSTAVVWNSFNEGTTAGVILLLGDRLQNMGLLQAVSVSEGNEVSSGSRSTPQQGAKGCEQSGNVNSEW
jgi:hypothetical protein